MAAGQLVSVYRQRYGLPVVEARPFNHIGPRQAPGFVVPDFAGQLAAIRLGRQSPEMRVGNLESQRDFTDVRDVVRAYNLLAEGGEPGEAYLICSGQPVSIRTVLDELLALAGREVAVVIDPARMKPSDTPCIYGSYAKLHAQHRLGAGNSAAAIVWPTRWTTGRPDWGLTPPEMANPKERLDKLLVERGLVDTRAKARGLIMAGEVFVDGRRVDKAGTAIPLDAEIDADRADALCRTGGLQTGRSPG